jgi:CMP/dCMP kinase
MPTRITIAGDIGSGKTTVARTLAERVGVEALSTGGIQRQLAFARGITTLELNKLAENDGSIDHEIDGYLKKLPDGNLVVESRMAWHFVPDTLKVFLYVVPQEAARRIFDAGRNDEIYKGLDDALAYIAERRRSEIARFKKYYNVNIDDLRNYDLVVDTTYGKPAAIADMIMRPQESRFPPSILVNPRNLIPTQNIRDLKPDVVEGVSASIKAGGFDADRPIMAVYVDHAFYVTDGHKRAAAAVRQALDYVPIMLVAAEDEASIRGLSARQYVQDTVRDSWIYDWENALGFRYDHAIWRSPAGTALSKKDGR